MFSIVCMKKYPFQRTLCKEKNLATKLTPQYEDSLFLYNLKFHQC